MASIPPSSLNRDARCTKSEASANLATDASAQGRLSRRVYLDNAATTWPKPESVYAAVENYQRSLGAAAGRSGYGTATSVARLVDKARLAVARFIRAAAPSSVVFTCNGTESLNIAIHGTLQPGDHVVTTVAEHNSVLRPLRELRTSLPISVTYVDSDDTGRVDPRDIQAALRNDTRLVVVSHASNVTGTIQPIYDIAKIVAKHPALFLVDAAQTAGHIPIDVGQDIDLLATPGHKGLLGPLGTGILYVGDSVAGTIRSLRQGGTGTSSDDDRQPDVLPERLESGNLNVPGLVGLAAGIDTIVQKGLARMRQDEIDLTQYALERLRRNKSITIQGPKSATEQVGVVSLTVRGHDPHELSALLDAAARVETRSGLHCAPRMHQRLGTSRTNGTVRISFGPFNSRSDIDVLTSAIDPFT